jgi:membrane protease YdiL (CAAX protease family)
MASELPAPENRPLPAPRGRPLLAWLVILGVVLFLCLRTWLAPRGDDRAVRLVTLLMQARYLVGMADLGLPGGSPAEVYRQGQAALDRGPFEQRLRFAVVAGELAGPAEALRLLRRLERDRADGTAPAPEGGAELAALLERLYAGYEQAPGRPPLSDAEQQELRRRLGWFGELALAPSGGPDPSARASLLAQARRAALTQFAAIFAALFGACIGLALLVFLAALVFAGRLHSGLRLTGHGGIYAETFAVYLVLFVGLSYAALGVPAGRSRLLLGGAVMLASLAALAWPVLRGVPWRQVRHDLGLFAGARPALEALLGVGCYLTALPLLLGGLAATLLATRLLERLGLGRLFPEPPSHPIVGLALGADVWTWLQVVLLAAVLAPLVEETMFRGVLYRHLREASDSRLGGVPSALFSALLSSLVFAAIHPQGLLGVPVLMALALAFALAREWRGTLLPAMLAHGLNNASVTLLLALATGWAAHPALTSRGLLL